MNSAAWSKALKTCADPRRARHFLELLSATEARSALQKASPEQTRILAALMSGSNALGTLLAAHPGWLAGLTPDALKFPRTKRELLSEAADWVQKPVAARDYASALARVREFKERQMLRIAARDLARLANVSEITQEISDTADLCLARVWQICRVQLTEHFGQPYHQDADGRWHRTEGCVLGMGKLGGQELNYSSDVDVILAYSEEGSVFKEEPRMSASINAPGNASPLPSSRSAVVRKGKRPKTSKGPSSDQISRPVMTNHQFFNRLAEAFTAEVAAMAPEGMLYRIDWRLRPEGDAGPLSRSMASYENYYAQWGQTWERMMLIKARHVAGNDALAGEFLEMIQPFRYPRSVNESVLREVAAMKNRIETEVVKKGELERNVKLGPGGIREIEFLAQAWQLLHAGRQPFLQGAQTLPALKKLAQYHLLLAEESLLLRDAYCFLRDLEHRLQMEANLQTHTIPSARHARERLARLMGFPTLKTFEKAHATCRRQVRRIFDKLLAGETAEATSPSTFPSRFEGAEAEWKALLASHGFKDIDKAFRVLREFVEGPGFVHVSSRTSDLAYRLLPKLFALCPVHINRSQAEKANLRILSDPDRVVMRLDSFIVAYGARSTLFELWNSHPAIFELLILLFDRSEFLAELAIRTPDLVDELMTSGRLRQRKAAAETLRDLRHGLKDKDQHLWLRRYHQAELMRIGLRDILGLADPEQYLAELSALADACLQYALEVVMRESKINKPPFVIIGLGKLGGAEIDSGSDLDLLFVSDPKSKNLAKLARLAIQIMELLSSRTSQGLVFQTDARLRPDGEKGLLVNSLEAYEEYYRQRAQLWEIQSLTRTRPVAGDLKLGGQFQRLAAALANFRDPSLPLSAYTPDWKQKIHRMRMRIEKERTPPGKDDLAIKTGQGGLMDAEFIAQASGMEMGWQEANTLRALERGRDAGMLAAGDKLIESYRQLRRVEGILRQWSYEGETVLPEEPAAYARVSVRCGFLTPEAFREAMAVCRRAIREGYLKVFQPETLHYSTATTPPLD